MSIHLFFNIVTAFVNAQFVTISEFFNAGKIEQFRLPLQPLFGCRLELIVGRKSLSKEVCFQIWKQMVITWCQVRRIWWMTHFFKSAFKYCSLSNMRPVSRCIVVQKQRYMGQLSSALLFNCDAQFPK